MDVIMTEQTWKQLIRTTLVALLIGGASGIVTASLTSRSLADYALELDTLTEPLRLTETRPRSVPQSYVDAVKAVREKAVPALAAFYDPLAIDVTDGIPAYDPRGAMMQGAVLTSDGWILGLLPTTTTSADKLTTVSVVIGNDVYRVEQVVLHPDGRAVFVKVNGRDLPVMAFGSGFDAKAGDQIFLIETRGGLRPVEVVSVSFDAQRPHADTDATRWLKTSLELTMLAAGTPATDASGSLIGLVDNLDTSSNSATTLTPIDGYLPAFRDLLRQTKIVVPSLGVTTLDLAHAVGVPETLSRGEMRGALVREVSRAAIGGGLGDGDIILSVDGEAVGADRTLAERLIGYAPGDTVELVIDRDGKQQTLTVTVL